MNLDTTDWYSLSNNVSSPHKLPKSAAEHLQLYLKATQSFRATEQRADVGPQECFECSGLFLQLSEVKSFRIDRT
jgi:hypothetical protein